MITEIDYVVMLTFFFNTFQIEGGYAHGGRSLSNWDVFSIQMPGKILDGSNGCTAINHYNEFKEDVRLMKKLGLDAYRFSISWSRILPGIEPYVTIFHFDVPQCLESEYGGFLSPRIVQDFAEFAEVCFFEFGDRVKYWITQNEPWSFTRNGYVGGNFPPGRGSPSAQPRSKQALLHRCVLGVDTTCFGGDAGTEPYIVAHHLILAHAVAVDIYRKNYQAVQGGKIGVTHMSIWCDPYTEAQEDIDAADRAIDFMWGWFVAPIVTGDYPPVMRKRVKSRLPEFTPEQKKLITGSYDFIGMNYYTTYWGAYKPTPPNTPPTYTTDQEVEFFFEKDGVPIGEQAGSEWLYIVPYGIRKLLLHIKSRYNDPIIYITENGVNEKNDTSLPIARARRDEHRIKYHQDHFAYIRQAMDEGVNIKGYFLWSLFDNYEWSEGYTVRFGIIYVDYVNGLTRYPKLSAIWQDFAEFAEVCFFEFGDWVKYWITQNEPWSFTRNGYVGGNFPPGRGSPSAQPRSKQALLHRCVLGVDTTCLGGDAGTEPYIVAHHLILAHAIAVDIYRKNYQAVQGSKIGVTHMSIWCDPYTEAQEDIDAADRAIDFMWGRFVSPIVTGDYPPVMRKRVESRLLEFTPEQKKLITGSYNFIGMNYYTTYWAAYKPTPPNTPPTYTTDQEVEFFCK
ncbi:Oleuropein beta-glucosidase [Sesamum alatum]|uniref:Oleuropein beta-glucosidase n=1 Tax=Sesamum alatum TaxID=300844 RepID=A0AAE1XNZ9_9LAMI|nr:Oleuropein beta-glucosidase [Sesamum alatum]